MNGGGGRRALPQSLRDSSPKGGALKSRPLWGRWRRSRRKGQASLVREVAAKPSEGVSSAKIYRVLTVSEHSLSHCVTAPPKEEP